MATRHVSSHTLAYAHSATLPIDGPVVYVVCGFGGCQQRLAVPKAEWALEVLRRQHEGEPVQYLSAAVQVD